MENQHRLNYALFWATLMAIGWVFVCMVWIGLGVETPWIVQATVVAAFAVGGIILGLWALVLGPYALWIVVRDRIASQALRRHGRRCASCRHACPSCGTPETGNDGAD